MYCVNSLKCFVQKFWRSLLITSAFMNSQWTKETVMASFGEDQHVGLTIGLITHQWSQQTISSACWVACVAKLLIRQVHGHAAYYIIACNCTCAFLWLFQMSSQCKVCTAPSHCTRLDSFRASSPRVLHDSASFVTSSYVFKSSLRPINLQRANIIGQIKAERSLGNWYGRGYYNRAI